MKNLLLMRHGKSSWELNVGDQDRPLGQRGITDAHLVGKELAKHNYSIDHVYSSPANRALHTCMICIGEMGHSLKDFSIVNDLYDFSGERVINVIRHLDNALETVLIFGHNHAFTYLANLFGDKHLENVPTSGFVHIQFKESSWAAITQGVTIQTIFPKQLKAW
ncbi:phosphohistidine phosphatase [Maribacter sedimenticola]|uniref:phosphoglycerate mutase (2,3-diphosphoglycerate-dependent) n=1 Tax=Maribacter sedimenticola TaxID=228956 RepID=A0ABY1SFJ5_9FLAO|nr:histidine phosphatase family protein [Maribacter sedimenticola]SNR38939.1 phosphohistidine phosphatase [Maribacter sedimenticola]